VKKAEKKWILYAKSELCDEYNIKLEGLKELFGVKARKL